MNRPDRSDAEDAPVPARPNGVAARLVADLAEGLPDWPRWIETRWMLLSGWCAVTGLSPDRTSYVVASTRRPLVAVVGRPEARCITAAAAALGPGDYLIAPEEHAPHTAAALPGWTQEGAVIYRWPTGATLPVLPPGADVRPLSPGEVAALDHLPSRLAEELRSVSAWSAVVAAFADRLPAAFCYACAVTETLWDVSIDTIEAYRGRGLAVRAVRCLMGVMAQRGLRPVWGAADGNRASQRLAEKLGFERCDRLALFARPT